MSSESLKVEEPILTIGEEEQEISSQTNSIKTKMFNTPIISENEHIDMLIEMSKIPPEPEIKSQGNNITDSQLNVNKALQDLKKEVIPDKEGLKFLKDQMGYTSKRTNPRLQMAKATLKETTSQTIPVPDKLKNKAKTHIQTYSDQYMRVPSKIWLSKKLHLSLGKTTLIMKALLQDEFFIKKGNTYVLSNTQGDDIRIPTNLDRIKAKVKLSPAVIFMKVLLFTIGCGATYMSIFHSTDFLSEYYTPFKSILAAIIMISFNVLSADMIVFFYLKSRIALVWLFSVILIFGTIFSMGSTVIGLYNSRAVEITESHIIENTEDQILKTTQLNYDVLLSRKSQAEQNLNSERNKRDGLVKILNSYTPEMIENNQEYYNKQNGRRYVADVRVDDSQKVFDEIILEEQDFLKRNTVVESTKKDIPKNAYSWIAGAVFSDMKPESLQFWMSVYPALFYDIIAPISFSIVFFVGGGIPVRKVKKIKTRRRRRK